MRVSIPTHHPPLCEGSLNIPYSISYYNSNPLRFTYSLSFIHAAQTKTKLIYFTCAVSYCPIVRSEFLVRPDARFLLVLKPSTNQKRAIFGQANKSLLESNSRPCSDVVNGWRYGSLSFSPPFLLPSRGEL